VSDDTFYWPYFNAGQVLRTKGGSCSRHSRDKEEMRDWEAVLSSGIAFRLVSPARCCLKFTSTIWGLWPLIEAWCNSAQSNGSADCATSTQPAWLCWAAGTCVSATGAQLTWGWVDTWNIAQGAEARSSMTRAFFRCSSSHRRKLEILHCSFCSAQMHNFLLMLL
jgi:hypothetical protein